MQRSSNKGRTASSQLINKLCVEIAALLELVYLLLHVKRWGERERGMARHELCLRAQAMRLNEHGRSGALHGRERDFPTEIPSEQPRDWKSVAATTKVIAKALELVGFLRRAGRAGCVVVVPDLVPLAAWDAAAFVRDLDREVFVALADHDLHGWEFAQTPVLAHVRIDRDAGDFVYRGHGEAERLTVRVHDLS